MRNSRRGRRDECCAAVRPPPTRSATWPPSQRWGDTTDICMKERFEEKFTKGTDSECWLWKACVSGHGYGQFKVGGVQTPAHRVAYQMYVGSIPQGLCVLHKCDVRACVNPAHLFLGTHADNAADRASKGRNGRPLGDKNGSRTQPHRVPRGARNGNAKLSEREILEIRHASGITQQKLANKYGVSFQHISKIRSGEYWAHVT